jgi:outer membrane lipoprotein-sorting protein
MTQMRTLPLRRLLLIISVLSGGFAARAEPAILAKARSYLGAEAALEGIKSVHYTGTLVTSDPADSSKPASADVDIVFQKPGQQRISIAYEKAIEQTALDGYDAWQRQQDVADPSKWRQTLLSADQIKRLRANTLENLMFFRGLDRFGVKIEDLGTANVEGVACQKIAFIHGPNIVFTRYFETATGRLVLTETEAGGAISEQGSMTVNGVRFPKTIITVTKTAGGKVQSVTINFEKIVVNEVFPASFFAVPALSAR